MESNHLRTLTHAECSEAVAQLAHAFNACATVGQQAARNDTRIMGALAMFFAYIALLRRALASASRAGATAVSVSSFSVPSAAVIVELMCGTDSDADAKHSTVIEILRDAITALTGRRTPKTETCVSREAFMILLEQECLALELDHVARVALWRREDAPWIVKQLVAFKRLDDAQTTVKRAAAKFLS